MTYQIIVEGDGAVVALGAHRGFQIRMECHMCPPRALATISTFLTLPLAGGEFSTSRRTEAPGMAAGFDIAWAEAVSRIDRLEDQRSLNA